MYDSPAGGKVKHFFGFLAHFVAIMLKLLDDYCN